MKDKSLQQTKMKFDKHWGESVSSIKTIYIRFHLSYSCHMRLNVLDHLLISIFPSSTKFMVWWWVTKDWSWVRLLVLCVGICTVGRDFVSSCDYTSKFLHEIGKLVVHVTPNTPEVKGCALAAILEKALIQVPPKWSEDNLILHHRV